MAISGWERLLSTIDPQRIRTDHGIGSLGARRAGADSRRSDE